MIIMYQRISNSQQSLASQEELKEKYKVEKVYTDNCTNKDNKRPELERMLDFLREGDVVLVESISRLARNVKELLSIVDTLKEKRVQFISVKENIDTNTPTGKFCLTLFESLAELEKESIKEKQAEGIALAKEKGVYKGRAPMEIDENKFKTMCEEWKAGKRTATSIQKEFDITGTTFYRWIKEYGYSVIDEELYDKCLDYAIKNGIITISLIQRVFSLGFNKANAIYECLVANNPKWKLTKKGLVVVK